MSQAKQFEKKEIKFFDSENNSIEFVPTFLNKVMKYKKTFIVSVILLMFIFISIAFSSLDNLDKRGENQSDVAQMHTTDYLAGYFPSNEEYEKEWLEMQNGKEDFHIPGSGQSIINKRLDTNLDTAKGHRERVLDNVEDAWRTIAKSEKIIIRMNDMQQTQLDMKK